MGDLICKDAKFGKLTVIEFSAKDRSGEKYRCRCECGNECVVYASKLRLSHTKSCGCSKYGNRPSAIKVNEKFGRLTAIESLGSRAGVRFWKFTCDCGAIIGGYWGSLGGSGSVTWAGITEDVDSTVESATSNYSGASKMFSAQQVGLTVSGTQGGTAANGGLAVASWGP